MHIDDWLDAPATTAQEEQAKEWLEEFRKPAIKRDNTWLRARRLTCTYEGQRYRCTGASRLGDVWLTADMAQEVGYQQRVNVMDCSDWQVEVVRDVRESV